LINGVLRQFQRQQESYWLNLLRAKTLPAPDLVAETPAKAYPQQWQAIVEANNQRPPMWLRVTVTIIPRRLAGTAGKRNEGFTHPAYPDAVRMATAVPVTHYPVLKRAGLPYRMPPLRAA
jgi:16S rRNA (cytosine967-C5)-methyltransferase